MVDKKLTWNPSTKSVAGWILNTRLSIINDNSLIKLKRYEGEGYDTYEVSDMGKIKLFVKEDIIKAICSGSEFFFKQKNLIGCTFEEVRSLIPGAWQVVHGAYYHEKFAMTLYEVDGIIKWVTIDAWDDGLP